MLLVLLVLLAWPLGSPGFGTITNAMPARSVQFGARYDW